MNSFRTEVTPEKPPFHIGQHDRLVSIGSCFSENIGNKFRELKFNININPFGQQYNPHSVAKAIQRLLTGKLYVEEELVYHDELYHSFDHHGSFSKSTVEETLQGINGNLQSAAEDLKKADVLFLTFGTSHVFRLKQTGAFVSNCHKLSGSYFERQVLKPHEIIAALHDALAALKRVNKDVKVILTVSPVRYFAFGHYENSVSKAHLFTAICELQEIYPELYYFPAYELVMDDLRDYRFFAEDMVHPNYQATNYVWQALCNTLLDKKATALMQEVEEIMQAVKHRPRNPDSEAHKKFVKKYIAKMEALHKQHALKFDKEIEVMKAQIG